MKKIMLGIVATLIVAATVVFGMTNTAKKTDNCCANNSACCFPGSPCCSHK